MTTTPHREPEIWIFLESIVGVVARHDSTAYISFDVPRIELPETFSIRCAYSLFQDRKMSSRNTHKEKEKRGGLMSRKPVQCLRESDRRPAKQFSLMARQDSKLLAAVQGVSPRTRRHRCSKQQAAPRRSEMRTVSSGLPSGEESAIPPSCPVPANICSESFVPRGMTAVT